MKKQVKIFPCPALLGNYVAEIRRSGFLLDRRTGSKEEVTNWAKHHKADKINPALLPQYVKMVRKYAAVLLVLVFASCVTVKRDGCPSSAPVAKKRPFIHLGGGGRGWGGY